jgi:hypothetical protein
MIQLYHYLALIQNKNKDIVRNCQTKTMPHVEKKDLLKAAGLPLLGSECSSLAGMSRELYRRSHTMKEGECSSQRTAGPLASIYL